MQKLIKYTNYINNTDSTVKNYKTFNRNFSLTDKILPLKY